MRHHLLILLRNRPIGRSARAARPAVRATDASGSGAAATINAGPGTAGPSRRAAGPGARHRSRGWSPQYAAAVTTPATGPQRTARTESPRGFRFHARRPRPPLDRVVAQLWWADGQIPYVADHLLPMPNAVLVVVLGDPFATRAVDGGPAGLHRHGWFTGPRQGAVVNRPLGHTRAVGAIFRVGGAAAVLGVPARATTDAAIGIDDLLATGVPRLRDDLDAAPTWQAALGAFEAFLRARLDPELGRLRRIERAVAALSAPAPPSVRGLADDLGITVQHLAREFRHWVGLSPRGIARLGRLRRLLDAVDTRAPVPWGTLAHRCGYADQAHLARDFRALTGLTPTGYVRHRLEVFGPLPAGSQPLFVPLTDDVHCVQDGGSPPA